jgi:hypothetical protein
MSVTVSSLLATGITGVLVIAAMYGLVDLRPRETREQINHLRDLNATLVATFNDEAIPTMNRALEITNLLLVEVQSLRVEVARLRGSDART